MIHSDTPPRRRFLALSVRGAMILVLLVSMGLGWIEYRARVRRESVAAIQAAGGRAYYDWQLKNGVFTPRAKPPWPIWLWSRLGPEYAGDVSQVDIVGPKADDVLMVHIGRLGYLETLTLNSSAVTDAGTAQLKYLTNLRKLD